MNIEDLKLKLRADYNSVIIPLVKECKCNICESTENLEVHHNEMFANQLFNTLTLLDIDKSCEFDEKQVEIIRLMMLGSQIKTDNVTLCDECHKRIHRENGGNNNTLESEILKTKTEQDKKNHIDNVLVPFLESIVDKKLYKKEQNELIDKIKLKDNYGRLQKSISLINIYLMDNTSYNVNSKTEQITIEGKRKKFTYWLVKNANNEVNNENINK